MVDTIDVVVVDDHTLFCDGIARLLQTEETIDVVATGGDGERAVALCVEHHPNVLILDVEMPGQPIDVTLARLARLAPDVRIVIITMHEDPMLAQRLIASGVSALVVKTLGGNELVNVVTSVARRDQDVVMISVPRSMVAPAPVPPAMRTDLSQRELEVLSLLAEAHSNHAIAGRLFITEGTVKRHLNNIYRKLEVRSRMEAVRTASATGLLPTAGAVTRPSPGTSG